MSSSDHLFAVMLDDGSLRAWRGSGLVDIPEKFGKGKIAQFAVNRHSIYVIPKGGGNAIVGAVNPDRSITVKPFVGGGNPTEFFEAGSGILLLKSDGLISINKLSLDAVPGLDEASGKVKNASAGLVSAHVNYREPFVARILWFDAKAAPLSTEPAKVTSAPKAPPKAMPTTSAASKTSATTVPDIPELRSRIAKYQTMRRDQMSKLAVKYGKALEAANRIARKSGDLNRVEAVRLTLKQAGEFTAQLVGLPKSLDVSPLNGLPASTANTPDSVKKLRPIFDAEKLKIEVINYALLEQSLNTLQVEQVKNRKIAGARAMEDYRARLIKVFAKVKASVAVVAAVKSPPPVPAKAAPTALVKKIPAHKGRLQTWSSKNKDDAMRLTRARGFDDVVQVYCFKGGWIALRENGDVVSSNRKIDRTGIARITKGWDSAFGMINEKGQLMVFASQDAKPKKPITNVKDAFISEVHSIALHNDGTITTWGPGYEGKTEEGQAWVAAPTGLTDVRKVLGNLDLGAVLTNEGRVIAWRSTGLCRMGNVINRNVSDIAAPFWGIRLINSDGDLRWWRTETSGGAISRDWKERYGPLKTFLHTQDGVLATSRAGTVITELLTRRIFKPHRQWIQL